MPISLLDQSKIDVDAYSSALKEKYLWAPVRAHRQESINIMRGAIEKAAASEDDAPLLQAYHSCLALIIKGWFSYSEWECRLKATLDRVESGEVAITQSSRAALVRSKQEAEIETVALREELKSAQEEKQSVQLSLRKSLLMVGELNTANQALVKQNEALREQNTALLSINSALQRRVEEILGDAAGVAVAMAGLGKTHVE